MVNQRMVAIFAIFFLLNLRNLRLLEKVSSLAHFDYSFSKNMVGWRYLS